jgi:hypothetical protein
VGKGVDCFDTALASARRRLLATPSGISFRGGALSFVPPEFSFEPWTVYAGIPIAPVKARNRESVLRQVEHFLKRQGA